MRNRFVGDPFYNNVILLAPFKGDITDYSRNPKTLTLKSIPNSVTQNGLKLMGSNFYSIWSYDPNFVLGTEDYTIEFKVRIEPNQSSGWFISNYQGDSNSISINIGDSGNPLQVNPVDWRVSGFPWSNGQFIHVAVTRCKGIQYAFCNGILMGSRANTTSLTNSSYGWVIGSQYENNADWAYAAQTMKDLRVTKGIARYTTSFTPPEILPLHGVPRISISLPYTVKKSNRPPIIRRQPIYSAPYEIEWKNPLTEGLISCIVPYGNVDRFKVYDIVRRKFYETGNASYFSTPITSNLLPGFFGVGLNMGGYLTSTTLDSSLAYDPNTQPLSEVILIKKGTGDSENRGISCSGSNSGALQWHADNLNYKHGLTDGTTFIKTTEFLSTNIWHTIGNTFKKPNVRLYTDGKLDGTGSINSTLTYNTPYIYWGPQVNSASWTYLGPYFRWNRILTDAEMCEVTSNPFKLLHRTQRLAFTPAIERKPVAIVKTEADSGNTNFADVLMQVPLRKSSIDESKRLSQSTIYNVSLTGDYAIFNGSSAYVEVTNGLPAVGNGDFTLECWAYQNVTPDGGALIAEPYTGGGDTVTVMLGFCLSNGTISTGGSYPCFGFYNGTGWGTAYCPTIMPNKTWYHIAGVRIGGAWYLYIDGNLVMVNGSLGVWNITTAKNLIIGRRWDTAGNLSYFNGYIKDVRLTNRAIYTGTKIIPPQRLISHGISAPL